MKKSIKNGKTLDLDFLDMGLIGVGNVGGGLVQKTAMKMKPDLNPAIGSGLAVVGGFLLTRTKNRMLQTLGLGIFSRGFGDTTNAMGIGDEAISESLDLNDTMEAELAAELAAEMEAELADYEPGVNSDGSY